MIIRHSFLLASAGIAAVVTGIMGMILSGCSLSRQQPPPTAASVDLSRYSGRWYEIARLPMPFQMSSEAALAEYGSLPNGTLSVHNIAIRPDGTQHDIHGYAEVLNAPENTKLAVHFSTWFAPFIPIPKEGNYWILYVEDNYHEAIVGTPDRKYLWILARTPKIPHLKLEDLLQRARKLGFDRSKMIFDP
jgi:apolipoprotein D and lipocalin family protein